MIPFAPDDALPHRDDVLDPSRVARLVEEAFGLRGIRCRTLRRTYRVGESVRAVLEVGGARGTLVGVRLERPERSSSLLARIGSACPSATQVASGAVLWRFPDDRRLRGLTALLPTSPVVGHLLGAPAVRCRLLRWAPEKSATAECRDSAGRVVAYAKAYVGDELFRTEALHSLAADAGCRVPPVLAADGDRKLLVVARSEGCPVDPADPTGLATVGEALARLHAVTAPADVRHDRLDPAGLPRAAELLGSVVPSFAERAARLAARLADAGPTREADVLVHGDIHLGNVLSTRGGASLIDLDQAAAGQAAAELAGSLLAVLRSLRVTGRLDASAEEAAATAVLAGYGSVTRLPDRDAIAWHLAAALLVERALRAVRRVRLDVLEHLEGLLVEAERVGQAVTA